MDRITTIKATLLRALSLGTLIAMWVSSMATSAPPSPYFYIEVDDEDPDNDVEMDIVDSLNSPDEDMGMEILTEEAVTKLKWVFDETGEVALTVDCSLQPGGFTVIEIDYLSPNNYVRQCIVDGQPSDTASLSFEEEPPHACTCVFGEKWKSDKVPNDAVDDESELEGHYTISIETAGGETGQRGYELTWKTDHLESGCMFRK